MRKRGQKGSIRKTQPLPCDRFPTNNYFVNLVAQRHAVHAYCILGSLCWHHDSCLIKVSLHHRDHSSVLQIYTVWILQPNTVGLDHITVDLPQDLDFKTVP